MALGKGVMDALGRQWHHLQSQSRAVPAGKRNPAIKTLAKDSYLQAFAAVPLPKPPLDEKLVITHDTLVINWCIIKVLKCLP